MNSGVHFLEVFELCPQKGQVRQHQQRMVLQSALSLTILRRELLERAGPQIARPLMFRWGYAQGYADSLIHQQRLRKLSLVESHMFGCALHTMEGWTRVEHISADFPAEGRARLEARWWDSQEADRKLLGAGATGQGTCWGLAGYASGFVSGRADFDVLFEEIECAANGAASCHVLGQDVGAWGANAADILARHGMSSLNDLVLLRAAVRAELQRQAAASSREVESGTGPKVELDQSTERLAAQYNFIVRSSKMAAVLQVAERVAPLDMTVLIQGETGTGKEFLGRFIHERSMRSTKPFVAVNCAAISHSLLESELFGHTKGAFTGAIRDKPGFFEQAGDGTLLLDEVGELPAHIQATLLRALENHEIRRVGGDATLRVKARIVASTNRDLKREVAAGRFREDLYYRLSAFVLDVPPLRERPEEIPPLAHWFLHSTAAFVNRPVHTISPEAMQRLLTYSWPGNVRELQHTIRRATVVCNRSVITIDDLPPELRLDTKVVKPGDLDVHANERALIEEALRRYGGNRRRAARALNMSATTLWRRAKSYGLS